jgi:hypothetical protein
MTFTELKPPSTHVGYWNRKLVADGGYQITRIPYNGGARYSAWLGNTLLGCALELADAKALCEAEQ